MDTDLIAYLPDGFAHYAAILDVEGKPLDYRFLAVNPAFEKLTGRAAQEVVGRTVLELWPNHSIEKFEKVVLTGEPVRFEGACFELPKLSEIQAYRPREGQLACIFRGIAESRASENHVDAYRAIFEGALEGIFRTSPDGRILAANPALSRMLGYDFETQPIRVSGPEVWYSSEDRIRFLRLVDEQGFVQGHECRLRRVDGTLVRASLNARKIAGPDGQTAYYEGFVEDITSRREMEEKLKATENKFKMAFMTGGDAAALTTWESGVVLEVNDRFTDLFGYSREEARGKTSIELGWYADDGDRERLKSALALNGHVENMEFQIRRKCGEIRSMWVSANSFESDAAMLLLVVVRDITDQKRAQAEKIKLEDQFQQAQKLESIGRMTGGIAHDFNNQLTVINGYGDLLLRACSNDDPVRDWVEEIRKAGDRAAKLVRQLLAISRKQTLEPRPMYPHSLVIENESMLRRLIGEDIELVIQADSSGWPVLADAGQIHQVVMNLAVNARDAMPRGGTLTIRTANAVVDGAYTVLHPKLEPGPYVSLSVSDTGVGMAKEIQEHIFDPFFTTKEAGVGTGLGLSTVHAIVRQLGGSVEVRSEPGRGATFEIYLPRLEDEVADDHPKPHGKPSAGGTETVLVVEDQDPVRSLAVAALKGHGYRVLEASNGNDALVLAQHYEGPIHLLLTDVVMPHMTGKDLADRLRIVRQEIRVLSMSGYAVETLARRGLLESGGFYIGKPFAPDTLAAKVREVLGVSPPAAAILVVDDEAGIRDFFARVLRTAGYAVTVACNGVEALEKVRERGFDLLLTDLVMPEKEGLELIMTLRKERPDLKVMAVSGVFGGKFLEAAKELGAAVVLSKPVLPDQLISAVEKALHGR